MERACVSYSIRFQDSIPCNVLFLISFFASFIALDHVRGLVCLLGVLLIMPMHHNKHEAHQHSKLIGMCTSTPNGIHRSCAAVYFWCGLSGFQEALAATIYIPSPASYLHILFIVIMWSASLIMGCLFYDSHLVCYNVKKVDPSSSTPTRIVIEHPAIGRAPDNSDYDSQ